MMRENTEKLERHEARERQLGEQLKKTITVLVKRVSAVDGLKLQLTKLDEKISGIEQLIAQVVAQGCGALSMPASLSTTLLPFAERREGAHTDAENGGQPGGFGEPPGSLAH